MLNCHFYLCICKNKASFAKNMETPVTYEVTEEQNNIQIKKKIVLWA